MKTARAVIQERDDVKFSLLYSPFTMINNRTMNPNDYRGKWKALLASCTKDTLLKVARKLKIQNANLMPKKQLVQALLSLQNHNLYDTISAFSFRDLRALSMHCGMHIGQGDKNSVVSCLAKFVLQPSAFNLNNVPQKGAKHYREDHSRIDKARHSLSASSKTRIAKGEIRTAVETQLLAGGFFLNCSDKNGDANGDKQRIRNLHALIRSERLGANRSFIHEHGESLLPYFARGEDVDPSQIEPELIEVGAETLEANLFRFATSLWSVPVSQGFGRRLRFLVRDRSNGKLIGVFALGDPVFNLSARDDFVGWTATDRKDRLVHVMDAYVVGAVPPYSQLIGGKLVAGLMCSNEVRQAYERKYLDSKSIISGKAKRARLVLLTTTSALGRSSIYNRLLIPGGPQFNRIGTTKGYGHFHVSGDIFDLMKRYLEQIGHPYASGHKFGMGPNWRFRVVRTALDHVGISGESVLKHGIEREVYAIPLAHNWRAILLGNNVNVRSCVISAADIADFCLRRWIIPRSSRDQQYRDFHPSVLLAALNNGGPPSSWQAVPHPTVIHTTTR